jgi:hypothetical protein
VHSRENNHGVNQADVVKDRYVSQSLHVKRKKGSEYLMDRRNAHGNCGNMGRGKSILLNARV